MIIKYTLSIAPPDEHLTPMTEVSKNQEYCCDKIIKAVQEDIYIDHKLQTAEIQCYDHNDQIIRYCWNCGKPLSVECIGEQKTKRNSEGVLVPI